MLRPFNLRFVNVAVLNDTLLPIQYSHAMESVVDLLHCFRSRQQESNCIGGLALLCRPKRIDDQSDQLNHLLLLEFSPYHLQTHRCPNEILRIVFTVSEPLFYLKQLQPLLTLTEDCLLRVITPLYIGFDIPLLINGRHGEDTARLIRDTPHRGVARLEHSISWR